MYWKENNEVRHKKNIGEVTDRDKTAQQPAIVPLALRSEFNKVRYQKVEKWKVSKACSTIWTSQYYHFLTWKGNEEIFGVAALTVIWIFSLPQPELLSINWSDTLPYLPNILFPSFLSIKFVMVKKYQTVDS